MDDLESFIKKHLATSNKDELWDIFVYLFLYRNCDGQWVYFWFILSWEVKVLSFKKNCRILSTIILGKMFQLAMNWVYKVTKVWFRVLEEALNNGLDQAFFIFCLVYCHFWWFFKEEGAEGALWNWKIAKYAKARST